MFPPLTQSDTSYATPFNSTSDNFLAQYTTQTSAFFAAIKAASLDVISEKKAILVDLLTPEIQSLLFYIGTRRITAHEIDLIHSLLSSMSARYDLKDAVLYLETYDWNLTTARLEYTADDVDRHVTYLDEDGNSPALAQFNTLLDRAPATAPLPYEEDTETTRYTEFDSSKFRITVNLNSDTPKGVRKATYTYPSINSFDWRDQSCLDDLNTWRRKVLREQVGPYRESAHRNGNTDTTNVIPDWHPLEERWCTSRYALTDLYAGQKPGVPGRSAGRVLPEYTTMANKMAPIFRGRWLPGRVVLKAVERPSGGVSSFLHRKFIAPKDKGNERTRWTQEMKHKAGQRQALRLRQKQWNLAATLPANALGPAWPPCEPSGDGMVIVQMEGLEMESTEQWLGAREGAPGKEAASDTSELGDPEQSRLRKRRRLRGALPLSTVH